MKVVIRTPSAADVCGRLAKRLCINADACIVVVARTPLVQKTDQNRGSILPLGGRRVKTTPSRRRNAACGRRGHAHRAGNMAPRRPVPRAGRGRGGGRIACVAPWCGVGVGVGDARCRAWLLVRVPYQLSLCRRSPGGASPLSTYNFPEKYVLKITYYHCS